MLQTAKFPRAPESNAIGGKRGLRCEWTAIQRDLAAIQPLPKRFPSADMTAYWLTAATHRVPWFRSLRTTWPQHIGPRRAGS